MFGSLLGSVGGGASAQRRLDSEAWQAIAAKQSAYANQQLGFASYQQMGLNALAPALIHRPDHDPEGRRIRRTIRTILTTQIPEVKRK